MRRVIEAITPGIWSNFGSRAFGARSPLTRCPSPLPTMAMKVMQATSKARSPLPLKVVKAKTAIKASAAPLPTRQTTFFSHVKEEAMADECPCPECVGPVGPPHPPSTVPPRQSRGTQTEDEARDGFLRRVDAMIAFLKAKVAVVKEEE